jgi:hypothetical protein
MVKKEYENKIIKQHYRQDYDSDNKELETMDHFYFLGIMINVDRSTLLYFIHRPRNKY